MTGVTDDPNDPRLTRGSDEKAVPQAPVYLVLPEEERAKGRVRPYRDTYKHVGDKPTYPLEDLTDDQKKAYGQFGYVKYEKYPADSGINGRFWKQAQLDAKACFTTTTMGRALSETYARDPLFYGSTYCCHCMKHRPVKEFKWIEQDGSLGPEVGS